MGVVLISSVNCCKKANTCFFQNVKVKGKTDINHWSWSANKTYNGPTSDINTCFTLNQDRSCEMTQVRRQSAFPPLTALGAQLMLCLPRGLQIRVWQPLDFAAHRCSYENQHTRSSSCEPEWHLGILPSDSMEKTQWRESSAYVHSVQQNETQGPLHALLSSLGHEGWDPQHTPAEALKPLQEAIPPLFTDQVLEGPLHHWGIHGH